MNNTIVYQQKRDRFGKFKSLNIKKFAKKVIKYQLIIVSILLNLFLAHKIWVVRCGYNGSVHGYFMTQSDCDTAYQNWFAGTRISVSDYQVEKANNPDLFTNQYRK